MIHRALVYLLLMRLKNTLLGFRKKPGRLVFVILLVVLFLTMALAGRRASAGEPADRAAMLVGLLALYFLFSLFAGLGEPGPLFPQSDVDFVFPAPFRRRDVLVYHLLRHYLHMLLLGLFYALFLGVALLPHPGLAYLGIVLSLVVSTQIGTAMTLVAARVSEGVFGRLRFATRLVFVLLFVAAGTFAVVALSGTTSVSAMLQSIFGHFTARVLLYPAVAVGDLALATTFADALPPLLGLVGLAVGSFVLVLLFPVNVLETATTRTDRKRRAGLASSGERRSDRATLRVFSGAGAVAWLNLLTLKRRLRIVVGALVMLLFVVLVVGTRSEERTRQGLPFVLVLLAYFPVLANLPMGFKAHLEHLDLLKTLPVNRTWLALAEVSVPALVLWVLQLAIAGILVATGQLEARWLVPAALTYVVLDVAAVAVSDLYQLGRDRRQIGLLLVMAQMMTILASTVPAVIAGTLAFAMTEQMPEQMAVALAAGILTQAATDAALLYVLGRRFAAFEEQPQTG